MMIDNLQPLKELIQKKIFLSTENWEYISSKLQYKTLNKKECVTKANKVENNVYFVIDGIFRLYIELEDKDVTIDFAFSNDLISSYSSFIQRTPSDAFIQSLTSSKVAYINYEDLHQMYKETPFGYALGKAFAEEFFIYKSKREVSFMKDSPTQRYLNLFEEQPHLIQKIPQKYLASYIGITPQALSRIRAKIY